MIKLKATITVEGDKEVLEEAYHKICLQFPELDNWDIDFEEE